MPIGVVQLAACGDQRVQRPAVSIPRMPNAVSVPVAAFRNAASQAQTIAAAAKTAATLR
jgi:hypothetical protein